MHQTLKRLRDAVLPGSNSRQGFHHGKMLVNVHDVQTLLRDYDRIDAIVRTEHLTKERELFKSACRLGTHFFIHRYLMSCAHGRANGSEKAHRHAELCLFYVAAWFDLGDVELVRRVYEDTYQAVHKATQVLTDNLDTEIGFPLEDLPDYDELWPKFFEKFHEIAIKTLSIGGNGQ